MMFGAVQKLQNSFRRRYSRIKNLQEDISFNTHIMKTKVFVVVPRSWQELTDTQLYYLYGLFSEALSLAQIKTCCLFRWGGLKVVCRYGNGYLIRQGKMEFPVTAEVIAGAIHALDWIDTFAERPVRIGKISGHQAVDAEFIGVSFETYLYCDNLYQGYLETQNHDLLGQMAEQLYRFPKIRLNKVEKISIFYWWASLKALFAREFPNFLQPAEYNPDNLLDAGTGNSLQQAMNAQIRALTKGDITKEREVLNMDTWRALTELDAQAAEYEEINRKYGKS